MNLFWIILPSLILTAIFSAVENSYQSINKLQLEIERQAHTLKSGILRNLTKNPVHFSATLLTGNLLSTIVAVMALTLQFNLYQESGSGDTSFPGLVFQAVFCTLIILMTAEFPARILSKLYPHVFLGLFQFPLFVLYYLLYPVVRLMAGVSIQGRRHIFSSDGSETQDFLPLNKVDLNDFLREQDKSKSPEEESPEKEVILFRNALDFSKVKLREIMVPRTEIEAMELSSDVGEIRQRFIETGYSRILLYDGNIDNVIGYMHSSSVFADPSSPQSHINKLLIVPETMPASRLLKMFIQEHRSIAVVVDEFGGTSGLVTTEDILEEIFGEIEDEHDSQDYIEKKISDNEFILSGRIEIDALNAKYGIGLPGSENYETLAGLILYCHESIPKINTVIDAGKFSFKILKATNTKIELVKLTVT